MSKGLFIVFEGVDGSGKSTQASILYERLISEGYECVLTEEPGGTDAGKVIKKILLSGEYGISEKTELLLFLADRAEHVSRVVRPSVESGRIVICSRYIFSTLVYQGLVRKIAPIDFFKELNVFVTDSLLPDLVFYIDVDPEERLPMAAEKTYMESGLKYGDRIEREGILFQKSVRDGYLNIAAEFKDIFRIVDGNRDIVDISNDIYEVIKEEVL